MINACKEQHVIHAQGLVHAYGSGTVRVPVLHDITFSIAPGELVALLGPSGSGKTTILSLVGCLRSVQGGRVRLLGQELYGADRQTLTLMRRRIGFIFQSHNLHQSLTACENVQMGLVVREHSEIEACRHVLDLVGLGDRLDFLPQNLSGGQKQRVAIARALVSNPALILADEPTSALDSKTSSDVIGLFRRLADQQGMAGLIVTHDSRILEFTDRSIFLEDGCIKEE